MRSADFAEVEHSNLVAYVEFSLEAAACTQSEKWFLQLKCVFPEYTVPLLSRIDHLLDELVSSNN